MNKKKQSEKKLIVGIDIGTSKVVTLIGEVLPDETVHVVGMGIHPSYGLKRGVVVNIESTVNSIRRSVEEAELMAGCQVRSAYTCIAGSHIRSFNSQGIVAIRDQEVTQIDIDRVIDAARAIAIPADQKILHILPQEFIVDNQDCIREPIGMSGVRLESKVHIISGAASAAQNIIKCIERCGLKVSDIILQPLASSYAVLSEDEKELGVCLVDVGGGTTDIAVFTGGSIRYTSVIPIAGDQMTNDIAIALRTPTQNAEEIKIKYGSVNPQLVDESELFEVMTVGNRMGRKFSKHRLAEICESRYEELFGLVRAEIRHSGFEDSIAAGFVLTGGSSLLSGSRELAERVLDAPVRIGMPDKVTGLVDVVKDPRFSTAIGLLLYGYHQEHRESGALFGLKNNSRNRFFSRIKQWLTGSF